MKTLVSIALSMALLASCGPKHIDPATPPIEQRLATYNQVVMVANDALMPVVASLADTKVIPAEVAEKLSLYQGIAASASRGIDTILKEPGDWKSKAVRVQNLMLSLIPPKGWEKLGVRDDKQVAALIAAINGIEATARIMAELARTK